MNIDDRIRDLLHDAIPPAETPPGLADELIARMSTSGGGGGAGGGGLSMPLVLGLAAVGGMLVGAAWGLFGGGSAPVSTAGAAVRVDSVPVYACPGRAETGTMFRGDRILITGRSGEWLAVRNVRNAGERVFVNTAYVTPDADISDLPDEDCEDAGILTVDGSASTTGTPSTTAASTTTSTVPPTTTSTTTTEPPTTTTSTLPPSTTTTTTTQAPDTTPPTIAQEQASPGHIWEQDGLGISCPPGTPRQATLSAIVTDDVGVTSVTASWIHPSGNQNVTMSASGTTYGTTFGPYAAGAWDPASVAPYDHPVSITITASDAAGNTASTTVSVTVTEIGECLG